MYTVKKLSIFTSPARMSLTKLSLSGKNIIIPGQGEFGSQHPGWGRKNRQPFLQCNWCCVRSRCPRRRTAWGPSGSCRPPGPASSAAGPSPRRGWRRTGPVSRGPSPVRTLPSSPKPVPTSSFAGEPFSCNWSPVPQTETSSKFFNRKFNTSVHFFILEVLMLL